MNDEYKLWPLWPLLLSVLLVIVETEVCGVAVCRLHMIAPYKEIQETILVLLFPIIDWILGFKSNCMRPWSNEEAEDGGAWWLT